MKTLALVTLINKGYDPKHLGTWYLAEAIAQTAAARRPLMLTKEVYPQIAKEYDTTASAVEKAMRSVVKRAEPGATAAEVVRGDALELILDEG